LWTTSGTRGTTQRRAAPPSPASCCDRAVGPAPAAPTPTSWLPC
jgi:hypothetical protein